MIGNFIGVDLDSSKIRVCAIKRGFRTTELVRFFDIEIPDDPATISQLLSYHLKKESVTTDIAVSVPTSPVSMRILSFPFSEVKKIDQVYNFELENASSLQTEDLMNSYHVVPKNNAGADALVCIFKHDEIAATINLFSEGGLNPRVVSYSPFALSSLSGQITENRPFVILSIGQVSTNFSLFDESGLVRVRSSSAGMEFIIKRYSELSGMDTLLSKEKVYGGFDSREDRILRQSFSYLFSEIKKTLKFFEFDFKTNIQTVLLASDGSLIKNLDSQLKTETGKDVKLAKITDLDEHKSPIYLNSYALALYGSDNTAGKLNYRKDEFKFTSKDIETRRALFVPAVLVCVLLLLVIVRNSINYIRVNSEIKSLNSKIEKSVREVFPEVKALPRPVDFMQNQVRKVESDLDLIADIKSGKTPLDIMRNISTLYPPGISVTIEELNFINDLALRLKGKSDSYDDITKVEQAFKDSGYFEKVERNSAGSALNKIKFEMSLTIK